MILLHSKLNCDGLRQVNHERCEEIFGNHPLNTEIATKKELEKFSAIKAI